jgi:DNA-directed RNA polymerase specialized sigma24 family protein
MALSREEFEQLVDKEYSFVCATLVNRFDVTPDEAHEAVHRKLADLLDPLKGSGYKRYDPTRGRFSTWLTALAFRAYIDGRREDKKWLRMPRAAAPKNLAFADHLSGRGRPDAETQCARRRRRRGMEDAIAARVDRQRVLAAVSIVQRDLLFRRYVEDWEWNELEEHYNLPTRSLKTLASKALAALRRWERRVYEEGRFVRTETLVQAYRQEFIQRLSWRIRNKVTLAAWGKARAAWVRVQHEAARNA